MTEQPSKTIWPFLHYNDARAAIDFLQNAFGFTVSIVVPDQEDPSVIQHAELRWPEGGGIMLSSIDISGNPFSQRPTGVTRSYVVTDQPDEIHDRAVAAGAKVFTPLRDEAYGSRGFSVTDPEGNVWDFGTYAGQV